MHFYVQSIFLKFNLGSQLLFFIKACLHMIIHKPMDAWEKLPLRKDLFGHHFECQFCCFSIVGNLSFLLCTKPINLHHFERCFSIFLFLYCVFTFSYNHQDLFDNLPFSLVVLVFSLLVQISQWFKRIRELKFTCICHLFIWIMFLNIKNL